ncbi:MAG: hypothetical protein QM820_60275 [Minicystis sp.]
MEIGAIAQLPRDGGVDAHERGPVAGEHARDHADGRVAGLEGEGLGAAEDLEEHRREREDVGLPAHAGVAHLELLGRGVAEARAGDGDGLVGAEIGQLHQAEVGDLGDLLPVVVGEQDVRRLEIAVDDALLVHGVQRPRDLAHEAAHPGDGQAEAAVPADDVGQRLPVDVLQRDEGQLQVLVAHARGEDAVVVEADDVGVGRRDRGQAAQHLGLDLEAAERLAVHALGPEHLHHDPEAVGLAVVGLVDPALAALADDLAEVVADAGRALDHRAQEGVAQLQT